MEKKNICILIRVYNRLEDLENCIKIIRETWVKNNYYILLVGNGKSSGYIINEKIKKECDEVLELESNLGHLKGNSQLIKEGLNVIPEKCEFTILLEADTWIYTDDIIDKYIKKMDKTEKVWASSEWIKKYYSLGLDCAITKTKFLKENEEIINFTIHPESWVCNYLLDKKYGFLYIKENTPVHIPKNMRPFYYYYGGRFRVFPNSKMITHHIEDLKFGIKEKKELFNICIGEKYFDIGDIINIKKSNLYFRKLMFIAKIFPNSGWFKTKKKHIF